MRGKRKNKLATLRGLVWSKEIPTHTLGAEAPLCGKLGLPHDAY